MKKAELTPSKVFQIVPKVVNIDRKVFLIGNIENDFGTITTFLGYEPKVEFENGKFCIKLKSFGKLSTGTAIVKEGENIVACLNAENVSAKYDIFEPETEVKNMDEISAASDKPKAVKA